MPGHPNLPSFVLIRKPEDVRTVLWPALLFGLTRVCWKFDAYAGIPLLMYFTFACAAISHNSMHCRVFYFDNIEQVWRVVLSLSYGHPVNTFIPGHNLSHHKFLQKEEDLMRTDQMQYEWPILNLLLFHATVAPKVFKQDMDYMLRSWRESRAAGRWCEYTVSTCVQMCAVVGVQLWLLWIDVRKAVLLWWLPRFFAQWAIVTMNLLQHHGCDSDEKKYNFARNFVSPELNYLMFNNGYHTIHHKIPNAHWSQYPYLHRRIVKPEIRPELDEPSMIGYVWKTYVTLG